MSGSVGAPGEQSPGATRQLTRPSVAALPRDLAAERQSFGDDHVLQPLSTLSGRFRARLSPSWRSTARPW